MKRKIWIYTHPNEDAQAELSIELNSWLTEADQMVKAEAAVADWCAKVGYAPDMIDWVFRDRPGLYYGEAEQGLPRFYRGGYVPMGG